MTESATASDNIKQQLSAQLAADLPGFRALSSVTQLSAGASKQTFSLICDTDQGERRFALRAAPRDGQLGDAWPGAFAELSLTVEAILLRAAGGQSIPVPEVLAELEFTATDGTVMSAFLMPWLAGETLGHRIVRAPELDAVRPHLARQCGEVLGRLHQIDWQTAGLAEHLPVVDTATLINDTWTGYRQLPCHQPMIDFTARWLLDNIPPCQRLTLVHGDFRNGNLMINAQGIDAVLDWELAQIGDPLRDLGWLCVNSWRFGNSDKPVGGFGTIDDLLAGYREQTGIDVSFQELSFWQVFGSFWWSVATLQMAHTWRTGANTSLERPAIGRRSSEAQMDCANLLFEDTAPLSRPVARQNPDALPDVSELLVSVGYFLRQDLPGKLESHDAFMARVAANSLAIAAREAEFGAQLSDAEQARLAELLGHTDTLFELRAALCARLREDMPLNTAGLAAHLRATVAGQLLIDQPNYSALRTVFE